MFRWHYVKDNEYPLDEEECFCEVDERWCILDDAIKAIDKQSKSEYIGRV